MGARIVGLLSRRVSVARSMSSPGSESTGSGGTERAESGSRIRDTRLTTAMTEGDAREPGEIREDLDEWEPDMSSEHQVRDNRSSNETRINGAR